MIEIPMICHRHRKMFLNGGGGGGAPIAIITITCTKLLASPKFRVGGSPAPLEQTNAAHKPPYPPHFYATVCSITTKSNNEIHCQFLAMIRCFMKPFIVLLSLELRMEREDGYYEYEAVLTDDYYQVFV